MFNICCTSLREYSMYENAARQKKEYQSTRDARRLASNSELETGYQNDAGKTLSSFFLIAVTILLGRIISRKLGGSLVT